MRINIVIIIATTVVVACTSAKKVNGPDGEPGWYMVSCEDDRAKCVEKAGETCPKGYDVADDKKSVGAYAVPIGNSAYVGESSSYRMLVKCRDGALVERASPPTTSTTLSSTELPNLAGLWIGNYSSDRIETVKILQEGSKVLAIKVTGDTNVPAGKPTFRAMLVGNQGEGQGHGAEEGYQNPRWVPGLLVVRSTDAIEFTWASGHTVRFKRVGD